MFSENLFYPSNHLVGIEVDRIACLGQSRSVRRPPGRITRDLSELDMDRAIHFAFARRPKPGRRVI